MREPFVEFSAHPAPARNGADRRRIGPDVEQTAVEGPGPHIFSMGRKLPAHGMSEVAEQRAVDEQELGFAGGQGGFSLRSW